MAAKINPTKIKSAKSKSIRIKFATAEQKEKSIKAEKKRLGQILSVVDDDKQALADGLIDQAAFLRVALAELTDDLTKNGYWEMFEQGNTKPYQRKRPNAETYASYNKNYQTLMRQLFDLLPSGTQAASDGFEAFVSGRREV